jgi:hypothetical protein
VSASGNSAAESPRIRWSSGENQSAAAALAVDQVRELGLVPAEDLGERA